MAVRVRHPQMCAAWEARAVRIIAIETSTNVRGDSIGKLAFLSLEIATAGGAVRPRM